MGRLEFTRLPQNNFAKVEQVTLAMNLVLGVGESPDNALYTGLFSYAEAQRCRIESDYISCWLTFHMALR
ncbi:catalase [Shewanella livingstonensis]|uniref:Catalase n=2 Tax=Shewanella livingstonensis TaxID=150120 RepID=A0A3G8LT65_9GAMM|nr:catalase [Shewanella livingstonensis]AZG72062.1 catalase [Shewanella livingstonensis]